MIRESIDNHWLMLAVRYGMPTAFGFGFAVIAAMYLAYKKAGKLARRHSDAVAGAVYSLLTFALIIWTAALWSNNQSWFCLILGIVASMAALKVPQTQGRQAVPAVR